jgi:FlgD Ig-like domain
MRKYFILCLILFTNILLAFDPPENVLVDDETGLVTWTPPATAIAEDDFDSYSDGDYLSVVSPVQWSTWNSMPGSGEDVIVTNAQASSPQNSILVEDDNNILLNMNDYIDGIYSIDLDMYIPSGFSGYYNVQKTSIPGEELGFQIYFQTDGTTIIDAGAASAATFNYYHDEWLNLRLVIDLDNDWCDFYYNGNHGIGFQWTLGAFGVPGLLQLGGLNFQALAYSTTSDIPEFFVDNVKFKDLLSSQNGLTGFNVYLDGTFQNYTTDLYYYLDTSNLVYGETYIAGVSAVYDDPGESEITEYEFVWNGMGPWPPPPWNLQAEIQSYNEVELSWGYFGVPSQEILYHSGYDNNGIGTNGVVNLICCARFTSDELVDYYDGWSLTCVNIFLHSMDFSYVAIQVYEGGNYGDPGTLIYEEDITAGAVALDWTPHLLSMPIELTEGYEYWIGYEIHSTGDHPCAVDMGPMVPDKGAWMYYDNTWQTLFDLGLDYNWVITGVVSQSDFEQNQIGSNEFMKTAIISNSGVNESINPLNLNAPIEAEFTREIIRKHTQQNRSRSLAGYKIYRDGFNIAEVDDPEIMEFFDCGGLDSGIYSYYVTAIFINPDIETGASNIEEVEIVLPSPVNVSATSIWPNILVTWQSIPGVQSYNMYIDNELILNTTFTFYLIANYYSFGPGYHIGYLTAVYTGGFESNPSYSFEFYVPTDVDDILPLITELHSNFPNPFNPATMIKFGLHEDQFVKIDIYNLKGQKIKQLINEQLPAGQHSVVWKGTDDSGKAVSSGVYLYKMHSGNYTKTRKMILLK